jgi:hypothetical protein
MAKNHTFTFSPTNEMINSNNQQCPIYCRGKICKFIKWDSKDEYNTIKIKLGKKFIRVHVAELSLTK